MAKQHPHSFGYVKRRYIAWTYCKKCGLVVLKNEASRRAAAKPCESDWEEWVAKQERAR